MSDAIEAEIDEAELDFIREDFPKLLASMQSGADRIRNIVTSLRNFSRLDEADRQMAQLHDGLDSTLGLLMGCMQRPGQVTIALKRDYAPNLPPIDGYPGALNQALFNILLNAIEAIEKRLRSGDPFQPTILIRTRLGSAPESPAHPVIAAGAATTNEASPDWVTIEIIDNDVALTAEAQRRLFDPFFTTKPVGQGMGLGLSHAYQMIVKQHGGQIRFTRDQPGYKTCTIALPCVHRVA